jgi:DNA helicase HerA-like ATPase
LDITSASLREFLRIWERLENNGDLNIESLGNLINRANMNELVRDALISRFHTLKSSNLFSADSEDGLMFEQICKRKSSGAAFVINLQKASSVTRKIIVELVLSKMVDLLERSLIKPIFLFAEEAHLYVKDTYWEDIITRMRHFGIFTTFVTNQPDALSDGIYRQVDNIFLFNFINDSDLEKISRVSLIDTETVKSVVRTLPQRNCLIIGKVVRQMPIVMNIKGADMMVYGETRKFFT